jgi:hypothetical protein
LFVIPAAKAQAQPKNLPSGKWKEVEAKTENDFSGGVLTLPNGEKFTSQTINTGNAQEVSREDVLTFPNRQKFTSETARSGPHVPYVSKDGTVVAIERSPATKTYLLYIYFKGEDGKFKEIKNVNEKVVNLLKGVKGGWAEAAQDSLAIEAMSDHTLALSSGKHQFKVKVATDGTLSLVK